MLACNQDFLAAPVFKYHHRFVRHRSKRKEFEQSVMKTFYLRTPPPQ